jgi:molybdopterin-containing oxidoreductase family iron-sulfur binding subunit
MQGKYGNFYDFWSNTLHDGVLKINISKPEAMIAPMAKDSTGKPLMTGVAMISEAISDSLNATAPKIEVKEEKTEKPTEAIVAVTEPVVDYSTHASKAIAYKSGTWEIQVYEKISLGNGNQSNNPWLHEMPDPISKVTWDNYITMHPEDVKSQGFNEMLRQDIMGSIATLTINGVTVELPVYPQPGQTKGTIGVALGYGRKAESLKVATTVGGANAYAFTSYNNENINFNSADVSIAKTDKTNKFAATQIQHTIMGREEYLLRETSLKQYQADTKSNNPKAFLATHSGPRSVEEIDLWNKFPRPGHHWAMSIDMNSCIGCSACVVSCVAENNVAVVGKDQISRTRDMFWLRIDRYYSSDMSRVKAEEEHVGTKQMYLDMENPSNNPKVTFQPMMCQHCNHAPCETVCPVLATSHSNEGVNQMAYNRCIGTRYCANNCPFKVRRFNWYNYNENPMFTGINPSNTDYGRMVLNPDVVVRVRGVMEKCSMCAQRTQEAKLAAKKAGEPLKDGAVKTACQQACPTNAIVFGDVNDAESQVSKLRSDDRSYYLLDELGVKPNISYMVKVRNQDEEIIWENEPAKVSASAETKQEEKKEA